MHRCIHILLGLIVVGGVAVGVAGIASRWMDRRVHQAADQAVRDVVAREELILRLTPELNRLTQAVYNLRLPDHRSAALFTGSVQLRDLAASGRPRPSDAWHTVATRSFVWPLGDSHSAAHGSQLRFWQPFLADCTYFENARFYFIRGEFTNSSFTEFQSDIGFAGLARTASGWTAVRARNRVVWQRHGAREAEEEWRITRWQLNRFETMQAERPLFSDVLIDALPRRSDRRRATVSRHHQILVENYFAGVPAQLPAGYRDSRFFPDSNAMHPGLSVVDINRDGFDDLYVTVRWGKNLLLRNAGDGTFTEVAAEYGLDIEGRSSCAVFADFDNDGDADLMLGRTLERSMYLVVRQVRVY